MNRDYKFLCSNDDDLSENNSTYNMKLNNTKCNNMINNNNVDYYPLYKNDDCLGALCNNEGCLVACNMKLIDTKRDDYLGGLCVIMRVVLLEIMMLTISNILIINHYLALVTM